MNWLQRDDLESEIKYFLETISQHKITSYQKPLFSSEHVQQLLQDYFERRVVRQEPLQYILQEAHFYGHKFIIPSRHVLIPRFDTEILIDAVQSHFPTNQPLRFLEIGCGSGCISLTLCKLSPLWKGVAIDKSPLAIQTTQLNQQQLQISSDQLQVLCYDVTQQPLPLEEQFDVIVSNPPYISTEEISTLEKQVKEFEPLMALDGGKDGLDFYRFFFTRQLLKSYVKPNGLYIVEIGYNQKEAVTNLIQEQRDLDLLYMLRDLHDQTRIAVVQHLS